MHQGLEDETEAQNKSLKKRKPQAKPQNSELKLSSKLKS